MRQRFGHSSSLALIDSIVTRDGREVCDGAHSTFVRLREGGLWGVSYSTGTKVV